MLTCIACSKQLGGTIHHPEEDVPSGTPSTKQAIKALTAQIKDMALKASGAYKHCKPCAGSGSHRHAGYVDSDVASASERFHYSYRRTGSASSTPRIFGKELKGLSSGERTPSMSGRTESASAVVLLEEEDVKEWVAQVEPGVLITFVTLPQGGNDLKRIRFRSLLERQRAQDREPMFNSETICGQHILNTVAVFTVISHELMCRDMFNKWQAQRWWAENYDKVMELYNVQRFNRQAVPLPTPPRSEDESSKMESAEDSPVTPPLSKERLPRNFQRPIGMGYSSSDSLDHHPIHSHPRHYYDSGGPASTPKLSSLSGAKTETSSMDASIRTSSSREGDRSGELSVSISNASDQETEWVEQDEPGVYITIRALPGGTRELRRVRFSRERFGEMHARLWWEENRARIHAQYL